jgi:hypothetical protein
VTTFIRCDGGCGKQWAGPVLGTTRGPAIQVERVNGMGGGGMPEPARPLHFCEDCGPALLLAGGQR